MGFWDWDGDWLQENLWDPIKDVWQDYTGETGQSESNATNIALSDKQMDFQTIANRKANEWNMAANAKSMAFSADQAALNRGFQERMSNTAMQRKMGDLKRSGLNPMLAFSQGGSSAPSGAMGSGASSAGPSSAGSMATSKNPQSNVVSGALSAFNSYVQKRLLKANLKSADANATSAAANAVIKKSVADSVSTSKHGLRKIKSVGDVIFDDAKHYSPLYRGYMRYRKTKAYRKSGLKKRNY